MRNSNTPYSVERVCKSFRASSFVPLVDGHLQAGTANALSICMNNTAKEYRVEAHSGDLRVYGGETMTSWGAHIRRPIYLTKGQAWAQAKKCMAENPAALVKVYRFGEKVWSNRPCAY